MYCLGGEKIQSAFEIHPVRCKQLLSQMHWSHCTRLNKNATHNSSAYAATTGFLKPCHAGGGIQVSGSLPAGHWWHLSNCSRGTCLRLCVLGVFTLLGNCGRHGSDIPSGCWTKLTWVIPFELPFPVQLLHCRDTAARWPSPPLPTSWGKPGSISVLVLHLNDVCRSSFAHSHHFTCQGCETPFSLQTQVNSKLLLYTLESLHRQRAQRVQ